MSFDQCGDLAIITAAQEITFPEAEHGAIIDLKAKRNDFVIQRSPVTEAHLCPRVAPEIRRQDPPDFENRPPGGSETVSRKLSEVLLYTAIQPFEKSEVKYPLLTHCFAPGLVDGHEERPMKRFMLLAALALSGCTGIPEGIEPVDDFELEPYLGTWYEIARLDHSFERGLSNVTANYSLREDGGVVVLNRGFRNEKGEWDEAEGKAYFIGDPSIGRLKVSFFGPFYGAYNVFELGDNYEYSMVAGPDRSYLWILAREPRLPQAMLDELLSKAEAAGYDTSELIFVEHDRAP